MLSATGTTVEPARISPSICSRSASASSLRRQSSPSAAGCFAAPPLPSPPKADDTSTNSCAELASAYTGTPESRSSISAIGRAADGDGEEEEGEGMRAHEGGRARGRGREERKEVR